MNRTVLTFISALMFASTASAGVFKSSDRIVPDGRLDEAVWSRASWNGGFRKFKDQPADSKIVSQTEFALLSDGTTLFVGVRCREPEMGAVRALKSTMLWEGADAIELFFAPSGRDFDFYHFAAAFCPGTGLYADFASERGKIHPDPYGPGWTVRSAPCEDGWSMEVAIPLSAFYMTRNRDWSETWLVNVCRKRPHNDELTSWSQMQNNFREPDKMAPVSGFPKRRDADDMAMADVGVRIDRRAGDRLAGELKMTVFAGEAGDYELSSPFLEKTTLALKRGENKVVAKASYPANGRHPTELVLTRVATGERYARTYPVVVDFEDIRVKLTTPQYRDNFYPGQDSSKVVGRVASAVPGGLTLTLEGPGIPKTERRFEGSGEFAFETPGFSEGTATLTVVTDGKTPCRKTVEIRKLAPTGRWMAWVENGNLVVNGRPLLPRSIYAQGYRGGLAFDEKFKADKNLYTTDMGRGGGTFEPDRLIPGLEAREGKKDVMPCKEYLDKVDAIIEANRDKDFVSWYISDEPECRGVSHVYLRNIYEHVKKRDPYHVVRCASRGTDAFNDCADWIETHPYLNPSIDDRGNRVYGRAPGEMGAFIEAFRPEANPGKCIGFLPTLFAYRYASIKYDYPTFREYVCHVWAAMVHGGKSLWPYAYHDMGDRAALYEGNRYVFSSFAALEELVLHGSRTWLRRDDSVRAVTYALPKERMFVVVNVTQKPQAVEIKGLSGDFAEFRGTRRFAPRGTLKLKLAPLETVIGTTAPHDAGLATYAETQALVDRLEAERVGRDSQILERYGDVVFAGFTPVGSGYKLIDGTRDVWAWDCRWTSNAYVEVSFPRKACTFRTVRVFGRWENDPVVSVRKSGAWVACTPSRTTKLENGVELEFAKPIKTLKIRFSFLRKPGDNRNNATELYELEVGRLAGASAREEKAVSTKPAAALLMLDEANAVGSEQYGARTWMCRPDAIAPRPNGGFTLTTSPKTSATVLCEFGPKSRYLTARAESFEVLKQGNYVNWSIFIDSRVGLCGGVSHPQPGVYMARLPKFETPEKHALTFYDYNLSIGFGYVAIEEKPADLLRLMSVDGKAEVGKGDRLRVALRLQNPCEELSAEFVKDYGGGDGFVPFAINGTSALTLNRLDKAGRYWGADFTLDSFQRVKGNVYVKVVTLGGGMDLPIFAISDFTFS